MEFVQITSSPKWPPCHPNNPNQPADCGWDPSIPDKSICLENYENAKKKFVKSKEPNYLMDLMDFCIKAQVNERETCTMKEFQGIYKSCEKIVIDEIKGFIAKDSEIHEMFDFDFEHDGAKD